MKFITCLIFVLLSILANAQSIYKQRMNEIYKRIQNSLQNREKNQYLKNPHVFKITAYTQDKTPVSGQIRLPNIDITCRSIGSNGTGQKTKIPASDFDLIRFVKWKKNKNAVYRQFTKFTFTPTVLIAYSKNGKKYYVDDEHIILFNRLYIFADGNETLHVFADFVLYFDRAANVFYKTNKNFNYHETHPAPGALYQIKFENYQHDPQAVRRRNRVERFAANPNEEIPMQRSESQEYFENERKRRLENQRQEQAAEDRQRAEEERVARQREETERRRAAAQRQRENRRSARRTN